MSALVLHSSDYTYVYCLRVYAHKHPYNIHTHTYLKHHILLYIVFNTLAYVYRRQVFHIRSG